MKKSILLTMSGSALCAVLVSQAGLSGMSVAAGQPAAPKATTTTTAPAGKTSMAMGSSPAMTPQDMIKHRTTAAMRRQAALNAAKKGLVVASKGIEKKGWKYIAPKHSAAVAAKISATSHALAKTAAVAKATAATIGPKIAAAAIAPAAAAVPTVPDYNGTVPNYANSPLPQVDQATNTVVAGTGIRKFVDSLPGLGADNANNLGHFIPVAVADTITYPGSDYYEIAVEQHTIQMHSDLPPTEVRGYVQLNNGTDAAGANTIAPAAIQYLGPEIVAQKGRPVRVKFVNKLPAGTAGDLFLPTDTTMMGAGTGPDGTSTYSQNRANLHLHGGLTPWISDGTPNQWTTPADQNTPYPKGVSVSYVPDMWFDPTSHAAVAVGTTGATNDPGPGAMTFYYTNQQSARLMWYHDHSLGITRLNVYAGEASLYELHDSVEKDLIANGLLPATEVPLVIEDKTYVPNATQLAAEDPTWDTNKWGAEGNLWFPHVYTPNQNPYDLSGANAMGRWDYGPWFWPPYTGLKNGEIANPLYTPGTTDPALVNEPPMIAGVPATSLTPEAFMDTPVVNGTPYPYLKVDRKAYRFRILNASNDRTWNLQLYYAKSTATMWNADGTLNNADAGEVPMVSAAKSATNPASWPSDGRDGGVPDPAAAGPEMVQVGNDGGLLPAPVTLPNQPVDFTYNRRDITVLNVSSKTLMLSPAERADVVVDFSSVPAGSQLILYNDGPAPIPAFDPRYDYYTGDPDQTTTGGAPTTMPGYGPNTRTLMQFQVSADTGPSFDAAALGTALTSGYTGQTDGLTHAPVYLADQHAPIVPQAAYSAVTGQSLSTTYSTIQANSLTFTPLGGSDPVTIPMQPKAIQELFETNYGRMNATLGAELPNTNANVQTTLPLGYAEPATEIMSPSDLGKPVGSLNDGTQIWKITHNGVDTHSIHFHLFDVQLINRVGWDGAVRLPDPNELGWKDTVRMNPLEDAIVAMRPVAPDLPFKLGDSIRPIDPTMPIGAPIATFDVTTGQAISVPNNLTNYGWEYVWHCHILGHEENDMMRPIEFRVSPDLPTGFTARFVPSAGDVLSWTAAAGGQPVTNYTVQRASDAAFTQDVQTHDLTSQGTATSWTDPFTNPGVTYWYRIRSENTISYSVWSAGTPLTAALGTINEPTALTAALAVTGTGAQATLTWKAPTGNTTPTGYLIVRATDLGFTAGLQSFPAPAFASGRTLTFVDTTVSATGAYYYEVRAFTGTATSAWSNIAGTAPGAPVALTATASSKLPLPLTVRLSWPNAGVVTKYLVDRSTTTTFTVATTTTFGATGTAITSTPFVDSPVAANTRYYYRVRPASLPLLVSPTATVTTPDTSLVAPTNFTATPGAARIALSWAGQNWATGYQIQRATSSGFTGTLTTVSQTGTTFTSTGLSSGTTYYYRVRAVQNTINGPYSATLTQPYALPAVPGGVRLGTSAPATGTATITVNWTEATTNPAATGFTLVRARNATFTAGTLTVSIAGNLRTYSDTGLARNTRYYYRLSATNPFGTSVASSSANITTPR